MGFGRQHPMHSGRQTQGAPESPFPDSLPAWRANSFCVNRGYIPEYSRGISRDYTCTTRGGPSLHLISRIASLQLLMWIGKGTMLKPNQKQR